MSNMMLKLFVACIFIGAGLQAQPSAGFRIESRQCEANHGLLVNPSLNEIFKNASAGTNGFLDFQEGLQIEIFPTNENKELFSKREIKNVLLKVKKEEGSSHLYTQLEIVFEKSNERLVIVDAANRTDDVGGEPMTSLSILLLDIVKSSNEFGYEGLLLADCEAGFCRKQREEFKALEIESPAHLDYSINISHPEKLAHRAFTFSFSEGILGKLNAIQSSNAKGVGSLFVAPEGLEEPYSLCVQLDCEESQLSLDINTEKMKNLEQKYNRFTRHLHLLLLEATKSFLNEEDDKED